MPNLDAPTLLVPLLAFGASIVFALSNHVQHMGLDHLDVRAGTTVNVGTTFAVLALLSPLYLAPATLVSTGAIWFAVAGLIVPSLSMTLHTASVRTIGPGLTAGLASTSPVFALVLAVVLIGEIVTGQTAVGTAVVVCGIAFIAMQSRVGQMYWPVWAVFLPLGAALARAVSHNVVKIGLEDLPNPLTGALIASAVSLVLVSVVQVAGRQPLPKWNPGYPWFAACGVLNGLGIVFLNIALSMGDVVVVAPLIATTPLFTLLIGRLFFRRETLGAREIAAMLAIFAGCVLIITR
jgi:DME family drug/metabolite transporter